MGCKLHNDSQVAIVGAGLLGRLLCWRLKTLLPNCHISLYDQHHWQQSKCAGLTAAGMISPLSELVDSNFQIYQMGQHSLQLWPKWLQLLQQQGLAKVAYHDNGSIVIAHSADVSQFEQFKQDIQAQLKQHVPMQQVCQHLQRSQLAQKSPFLAERFDQALWLNNEAYIDNVQLLEQLMQFIQQSDIQLHFGKKLAISDSERKNNDSETVIDTNQFDCVFDVRGCGALQSDVRGVRGELIHVFCPEVKIEHAVRLLHPRYKLYLVPKGEGHYVIGATELESNDRSAMSLQSMLELGSALYSLHPSFAEARIIKIDANLRPTLLDNMPSLQINNNVISINGLYRHGYLLAPHLINQIEQNLLHSADIADVEAKYA